MPDDTRHDPTGDEPTQLVAGTESAVPEPAESAPSEPPAASVASDVSGETAAPSPDADQPPVADTQVDVPVVAAAGDAASSGEGPDPVDVADELRGRRHVGPVSLNRSWIGAIVAAAVVLAGAGIALGLTSGSGKKKPAPAPPTRAVSSAPLAPAGPPCPLTGVPTAKQVPSRPALAIKIDNFPQARPQSGLDKADVVFEEPVEGGITRLVAVFQCQSPDLAGPIRSARAVDLQILDELSHPVFLHVGGINPVIGMLRGGDLTDENLFYIGSVTQHPPGRYAPYDTYVSGSGAWSLDASDTTPPAAIFTYSNVTPQGTAVTGVHIPFAPTNDVHWAWDAPSGRWLLSWGSSPAMVANGGQVAATNIVIQTVHVTYGPWLENDVGGLEVQSQMVGSGPVTVLRNGIAVAGTWQRASITSPTNLVSAAGTPIALAPGPTWVEIVPSTVAVTTTAPPVAASATPTH